MADNDDNDMSVTVLTQIADALELHNKILANHQRSIEELVRENEKLKERLGKVEAVDSIDASDVEFLARIVARLAALSVIPIDAKS